MKRTAAARGVPRARPFEEALRERDRHLEVLTDAMPALIAYVDRDLRYRFVNRRYEDWFGQRREDVVGQRLVDVLGEEAFARVRRHVEQVLAGDEVRFEAEVPYRHGGTRWVEGRYAPHRGTSGDILGYYALILDITERHRAEEALRASEERFRAFGDAAPALLWTCDADGRCDFVSRGWLEYTGCDEAAALGIAWLDAIHPDDRDRVKTLFGDARARRETLTTDYRMRRADGAYRWVIDTGRPRFDAERRYLGYIGSVIDAHERREAALALREADRRKDEFIATLSHELRNPLAPLRNAVHVLKLRGGTDPESAPLYEMMDRQIYHLVRLIDDLLEVSRISRGALELRRERVELATVIRNAIETSEPLMRAAGHQLDVRLPAEPIVVDGDPVRLAQLFANLLNNATKYTPPGGDIRIDARRDGSFAIAAVRDNGAGIAAEALPHVFEMFNRGSRGMDGAQGGLGVGLAVARQLARMHGGTLEAASPGPGQGTTFTVRLPVPDGRGTRPRGATSDGARFARRVLVVDDNADAADSMRLLLVHLGANVRVAHRGQDALALVESFAPDLVLLDIGMPGMDGYEVARRLRERRLDRMRVVALTGWGEEQDREHARSAGFDRHLVKPADIGTIQSLFAWLDAGGP